MAMALKIRPRKPPDEQQWDPNLPNQIFVRDYYPTRARVNAYSKPELLAAIAAALEGTPELERIRRSQFGKLFEIPLRKTAFSGKIVHNLLTRQLWTSKPHEVWFVFGGQPIRFSLREFGVVTGLNCGRLPDSKIVKERQNTKGIASKYISELVGNRKCVKLPDLLRMLKQNKNKPSWKKLSVALVIIVEGVVAVKSQLGVVNENIVEICWDIDFFLEYPWGRQAFQETVEDIMKDKSEFSLTTMVGRLKQSSIALHRFPMSIQLLAFEVIYGLEKIHRESGDELDFTQRSKEDLIKKSSDEVSSLYLVHCVEYLVHRLIHTTNNFQLYIVLHDSSLSSQYSICRENMNPKILLGKMKVQIQRLIWLKG